MCAKSGSRTADTKQGIVEYAVDGTGPAVLVAHGAPGGYDQGLLSLRELVGRGYSLLAPSRPGYLGTPISSGETPAQQAALMEALLDEVGIEQVVVAGLSAGGPCACQFALDFPERTAGLILLSAVTQDYAPPDHSAGSLVGGFFNCGLASWLISLLAHHAPTLIVKAVVDAEGSFDQETADRIAEAILLEPEKLGYIGELIDTMLPPGKRRQGLRNDLKQLSCLGNIALKNIVVPTLIVHGTNDSDVPSEHAREAAALIPRAELVMVDEGFHLLELSVDSDMIWDRMQQFLLKCHVDRL